MQAMRDEFARSVQTALTELGARGAAAARSRREAGALPGRHGGGALRQGAPPRRRVSARRARADAPLRVRSRSSIGSASRSASRPTIAGRCKRVLQQYTTLLTDYREMKVAFHDQLVDELKYAGCDLQALLIKGDPQAKPRRATTPGRSRGSRARRACSWPRTIRRTRRCRRICRRRGCRRRSRFALPKQHGAGGSDGERAALGRAVLRRQHQVPARRDRVSSTARSWAKCRRRRASASRRRRGRTICACSTTTKKECGAPGTVRRSYLHEGWTISLRCE